MKYLSILFVTLILSSCCSTKTVTENTNKKTNETAKLEVKKITEPKVPAPPKIPIIKPKTETKIANVPPVEVKTPKPTNEEIVTPPVIENPVITPVTKTTFDHSSWANLLEQNVSTQGNVYYKGFKNNKTTLRNYIKSLGENRPNNNWSKSEKMAYWINAYNAMTIDLIVRNLPLKSIKDIKNPWEQRLWQLGEKWYNLDEIEHKILRKMGDPRIHFAIVCASYSCPKLDYRPFTANNLDQRLTMATKDFISDTERNKISENNIQLSKIFKWFADDFKTNGSLIDFLNQYLDVKISKNAKKSFMDYSWNLNQ